ncbi:MAG: phospho-N-acetylmuramoyl-pentapeptide-transferase [Anaerolineales bacterium]|nr:phospho-N-acetylmuramoyl-pentapeptide-transferase [Anaerolineales bacterium]
MEGVPMALSLGAIGFALTVIWGGPLLRILRRLGVGKQIRVEGPRSHQTKLGTPTMGGLLIVIPVVAMTLLLNTVPILGRTLIGGSILLPLAVMVVYAGLGAIDDLLGLKGRPLRARVKFPLQAVVAVGVAVGLKYVLRVPNMYLPGVPADINLGVWYVPIAAFIILCGTNAVNITDGLDGLAGIISATAFAAYGMIAALQGQVYLMSFCFTVVGVLFAFLWFNAHPAELFMGDTGSLSVGAVLSVVALMTAQWAILPVIAIIPVAETASVILQVGYFKMTKGKRLFKMAPLHHHFELLGWSETQVVQRFWLIGLLAAMVGVALAKAM